ncbi:MAG TPA: DUF523 domain-containing protein [Alphaproteobacteria bacterium]|nr:DUF523 domain-containing protein [Alphaproteobacteria bacterium]
MPEKILVSACLFGERVRYDAGDVTCGDAQFDAWRAEGRLVPICPETVGGLPVPRPRARLVGVRVVADDGSDAGRDVTAEYERGAAAALALAKKHGVRIAILKQNSPSCGSRFIFSSDFKRRIPGQGLTATLLRRNGVSVFGEDEIDAAAAWLKAHERT